jgi:hypothetical protein
MAWSADVDFAGTYVAPVVRALAKEFDGNRHVWYVQVALGHLGNLTAQPSPKGREALLKPASQWTPAVWQEYCRKVLPVYREHFHSTPLLVVDEAMLLRDKKRQDYQEEAAKILGQEFARAGVTFVQFQLEGNTKDIMPFFDHVRALDAQGAYENAQKGVGRLGTGDDWPLWVPENRRNQGGTRGRDEAFLRHAIAYGFGDAGSPRKLPTTILLCQLPEILASHPEFEDYRPEVNKILKEASQRLHENDQQIFGDK